MIECGAGCAQATEPVAIDYISVKLGSNTRQTWPASSAGSWVRIRLQERRATAPSLCQKVGIEEYAVGTHNQSGCPEVAEIYAVFDVIWREVQNPPLRH